MVSAIEIAHSENIVKLKSLVKEGLNIDESLRINTDNSKGAANLLKAVECKIEHKNSLQLDDSSRDLSNHIVGYISLKSGNPSLNVAEIMY